MYVFNILVEDLIYDLDAALYRKLGLSDMK